MKGLGGVGTGERQVDRETGKKQENAVRREARGLREELREGKKRQDRKETREKRSGKRDKDKETKKRRRDKKPSCA